MGREKIKKECVRKNRELGGLKRVCLIFCFCALVLTGCGGSESYSNTSDAAKEEVGFDAFGNTEAADEAVAETDDMDVEEPQLAEEEETGGTGGKDTSAAQDKILVYEGSVSIDTMEFEDTVRAFKKAVEEYGGFVEYEQSYGGGGKYDPNSSYGSEAPRSYLSTARIPSESYQDFMQKAQGFGNVTESSSEVTNMTRQYGTLKAELEIYEAEYERYLKMFEEVSDDAAMVSIQEKLTELSLEIARTKSEMSVIDTDAAFSTVQAQISEVAAYKESSAGFTDRLVNVLGKSWKNMLKFFETLLFFFILNWYYFLLLGLIAFVTVKLVKRSQAKSEQKMREWQEERRQREQKQQAGQADNKEETDGKQNVRQEGGSQGE